MHEFRRFIEEMNLIDVSNIGGVFTWVNSTVSRRDMFFLSDNVVSN